MDLELEWRKLYYDMAGIHVLVYDAYELARVQHHREHGLWSSQVARHRRDWRRWPMIVVESESLARKYAERWTRVNFYRIQPELPVLQLGVIVPSLVYPDCNPAPPQNAERDLYRGNRSGCLPFKDLLERHLLHRGRRLCADGGDRLPVDRHGDPVPRSEARSRGRLEGAASTSWCGPQRAGAGAERHGRGEDTGSSTGP